jgi:hypothetical protein
MIKVGGNLHDNRNLADITRKIARRWRKHFNSGPSPKITSQAYTRLKNILDIWGIKTFKCTVNELFRIIVPVVQTFPNTLEQFTIRKPDVDQAFNQAFVY